MERRAPSPRHTYGWGRGTILASLANAMLLLISIGAIGVEAMRRLLAPSPVDAVLVAWVAGAGLLVNGMTAALFMRGRAGDLNLRTAFAHMASDAALSAGVLVTALVISRTGLNWLDPAVSLVIAGVIGAGTWGLLREGADLAMDAVPPHLDRERIAAFLGGLPGVIEVHDLHVWALSTTECAVTVHLVMEAGDDGPAMVCAAVDGLRRQFDIGTRLFRSKRAIRRRSALSGRMMWFERAGVVLRRSHTSMWPRKGRRFNAKNTKITQKKITA